MKNSIIVMQENLYTGEKISGFFSNLTVAINSVQWKSALSIFNYPKAPDKNITRVEAIINGEKKYVELLRKPLIGSLNIEEVDAFKIYELEIIEDLNNPLHTTTSKYFVSSEDAFNDPAWNPWKERIIKYKYEFKSMYSGHYINIKENKSIRVKSIKVLNNIFEDFYEDVD